MYRSDQLDDMIAWENGTLGEESTIALFQGLITSGLVWELQGCYGRMANDLIERGFCHARRES